MGVAEQMLLNQVTIFNPPSSSSTNSYNYHSSSNKYREKSIEELRKESARAELSSL